MHPNGICELINLGKSNMRSANAEDLLQPSNHYMKKLRDSYTIGVSSTNKQQISKEEK